MDSPDPPAGATYGTERHWEAPRGFLARRSPKPWAFGAGAGPRDDTEPRWVGMPLRVVRGQDRTTVDRRNDLAYDGLLITDRE